MSELFLVLAFLAAVNAARLRPALPEDAAGRARQLPTLLGTAVTFGLAVAGVALAERFLDALDVAPESFELAAGLVAVLAGGWAIAFPVRAEQPELAGWKAAIVPVAFPLLVSPEFIALVLAFGALEPAGTTLIAAAIGLVSLPLAGLVRRGARVVDAALAGTARLAGLALVAVGVQLIVEGVRDV